MKVSYFLKDWVKPILGGKSYKEWEKESLHLQTVPIPNKKLAQELENACSKNGGFLTYGEFLQIEQFGKNGYHETHSAHGFTQTHSAWKNAIFSYLQTHNIHQVIELGFGNGSLADELYGLSQKNNYQLTWSGIETQESFCRLIQKRYASKKFNSYLGAVEQTVDKLPYYNKALIISSYFLDSVPPEIVIHQNKTLSYPDSMIGITVRDGVLQEFILSSQDLETKHIRFENGVITINNTSFDISTWKLAPMQRAYVTFDAFATLHHVIKKVKDPSVLIIDEVRTSREVLSSQHILSPLYLSIKNRYGFTPRTAYKRSGDLLYYYPLYLSSILSFLRDSGFSNIDYDPEAKLIAKITNKKWVADKKFRYLLCFGVFASEKKNALNPIFLTFPEHGRL